MTEPDTTDLSDQQLLRYSRHILLDQIGIEGQQKISGAHALIIGAGGLGSPAALYLASAGVGKITIVDHDTVDLTNLQRQILHTTARVGQSKANSARQTLAAINPEIEIVTLEEKIGGQRLQQLVQNASVVLDCCDNFSTRHAVNQACVESGTPLISGAAISFDGQISVFDSREITSPCYACLFPPDQQFEEIQCARMGVFAPLVGIIGSMQAAEALKVIMGIGKPLLGRLLLLDAQTMEWTQIRVARNLTCTVCGQRHHTVINQEDGS
ncbi:HesA/MoeB/ThiF family protein [Undibacterium sp. RTI2.1]|uniref:HesA/MoeB/ThiF family protein n=1 Tax=unclassified Undibacterium TaxID=2630295 RepID=UPI002B22514C|nr:MULTISPECIES: HesA/MoeB/ThiF family protein [unclassified Undibacterium]MEB0031564.1 HesA/MoeB/ThiF family protein [Undibacterium sp. RTI2.1]MEB0117866.1 HesA/MoeB/ThiF family protein [Undibacterium sp. RTI2.2]